MRLRRSSLGAAGHDVEKVKAFINTNVDVIMLDVEDFVPSSKKDEARACIAKMLSEWDFKGKVRCVRINGWYTDQVQKDLAVILPAGVDEIKVSKCESSKEVLELDKILTNFEKKKGLARNTIELSAMIESPLGVRNCYEILSCTKRFASVSLGSGDLTAALGVDRDVSLRSLQLIYIKQKMILEANAAGVHSILDTSLVTKPGQTPEDMIDFVREDTTAMKIMGFTGRSAVYPQHAEVINEVFTPTPEEARFSRKVVESWREGVATGNEACFTVEGRHIDPGKAEKAERIVFLADLIEKKNK